MFSTTNRFLKNLFFLVVILNLSVGCTLPKPALHFAPEQLDPGEVGKPYTATIQIHNQETPVGEISITKEKTLPPGLTMTFNKDKGSAEISGTPTQSGTFNFIVTAWCYGTQTSGQNGQKEYSILIK